MDLKVSPSIICSKPWDMLNYIRQFEKCNIPLIHFDVMDGNFVPNITIGTGIYKDFHKVTSIPLDLHLMVQNPDVAIDYFDIKTNDRVSFHPQTTKDPKSLLKKIRNLDAKTGVAISPAIEIDCIESYKDILDFVIIMSVEPGFSGQRMIPDSLLKIKQMAKYKKDNNLDFEIFVDGDANANNARIMAENGAEGFVVGSALINDKYDVCDFFQVYKEYKDNFYR